MSDSDTSQNKRRLRIAISCGGSGGHINPGLATAQVLLERGHDVFVVYSGRKSETEPLKAWNGEMVKSGITQSMFSYLPSILRCFNSFRKNPPDALLAMGCYTSLAPCAAALLRGIPVVLHEANAVPGKANAKFAPYVKAIGVTFSESKKYLSKCKNVIETGLPLRMKFTSGAGTTKADPEKFTILVTGGSQGAQNMNELVTDGIIGLFQKKSPLASKLKVVHLAGKGNEEIVQTKYADAGLSQDQIKVVGFSSEMEKLYAESDFCISRSGASACFELALSGLPALFIPLENLAGDHQTFNAKFMAERNAGDWKAQHELTGEWITDYIESIAADKSRRDAIRASQLSMAHSDAASKLADIVESAAYGRL